MYSLLQDKEQHLTHPTRSVIRVNVQFDPWTRLPCVIGFHRWPHGDRTPFFLRPHSLNSPTHYRHPSFSEMNSLLTDGGLRLHLIPTNNITLIPVGVSQCFTLYKSTVPLLSLYLPHSSQEAADKGGPGCAGQRMVCVGGGGGVSVGEADCVSEGLEFYFLKKKKKKHP